MTASASASATVPGRPVLLTSLASAILADGQGDIRLTLESRGAPSEWGGVYGELVRLTGPWTVELASGDAGSDLPSCRVDAPAMAGGWRSRHRWHGLEIVQDVAATADPAGAVRRLTFRSESPAPVRVTVTSRFPPFLFPVLVEGIRPREFELRTSAEDILIRHQGFALRFASTVLPSRLFLNHGSWIGGTYRGRVDEFASEHELVVPPMGAAEVRWQVVGGLARDLEAAVKRRGRVIPSPEEVTAAQVRDEQVWIDSTPDLGFPDAPELEAAYRDARSAIRRLYSAPGPEMVGLVAGYPWYSSIWCRDLAVMLPALLWLGDFDWVEQSLATVFRFQSHQTIPLLAAEPGELPMQIAPGPLFLYGTSDSTLRFAPVVEQLHRHCGGLGAVDRWAEAVHRIVEWGRRRSDPATGLLRHGGEAESIAVATGHLARVQYGIDSPDTTIWDSADRRDHAIDVQVLW